MIMHYDQIMCTSPCYQRLPSLNAGSFKQHLQDFSEQFLQEMEDLVCVCGGASYYFLPMLGGWIFSSFDKNE